MVFRGGLRPGGAGAAFAGLVAGLGITSQSPTQKSNWRYSGPLQSNGAGVGGDGG